MEAKKFLTAVAIVICAGLLVAAGTQQHKPARFVPEAKFALEQKDTLVGIQSICVAVDVQPPELANYGITKEAIKTIAEMQLQKNGIKLRKNYYGEDDVPILVVIVNLIKIDMLYHTVGYAGAIDVGLTQSVYLSRKPDIMRMAPTWEAGKTIRVGKNKVQSIREDIIELIDEFSKDYLAMNPKGQPTKEKQQKAIPTKSYCCSVKVR